MLNFVLLLTMLLFNQTALAQPPPPPGYGGGNTTTPWLILTIFSAEFLPVTLLCLLFIIQLLRRLLSRKTVTDKPLFSVIPNGQELVLFAIALDAAAATPFNTLPLNMSLFIILLLFHIQTIVVINLLESRTVKEDGLRQNFISFGIGAFALITNVITIQTTL